MEPALKQRLIGAAVLVALAVIFLPMVLDGPAPPATRADAVPLDIPKAPNQPLQTREIPLTLPAPSAQEPAAGQTPADPDRVVTLDVPSQKPADVRPEDSALSAAIPAASTAPAPALPPAVAPAVAQPAAATSAPANPAPVAPTPAAATPPTSGFAVNLGTYANAANADALAARLRAAGLAVYAESVSIDGKPARRLRAGPYASRAAAEDALLTARQKSPDIAAQVVSLEGAAPSVAVAPSKLAGYAVQVSALRAEADANALRDKLRGGGFPAFVDRLSTDNGVLFRVRVGPEMEKARAEATRNALKQKFALDGMVVSHP